MTRDEIFAQLRDYMVQTLEIDVATISPESRLREDLDLDSIDAVELAVKMQELTGKRVGEALLRSVRTVGDVVSAIEKSLAGEAE